MVGTPQFTIQRQLVGMLLLLAFMGQVAFLVIKLQPQPVDHPSRPSVAASRSPSAKAKPAPSTQATAPNPPILTAKRSKELTVTLPSDEIPGGGGLTIQDLYRAMLKLQEDRSTSFDPTQRSALLKALTAVKANRDLLQQVQQQMVATLDPAQMQDAAALPAWSLAQQQNQFFIAATELLLNLANAPPESGTVKSGARGTFHWTQVSEALIRDATMPGLHATKDQAVKLLPLYATVGKLEVELPALIKQVYALLKPVQQQAMARQKAKWFLDPRFPKKPTPANQLKLLQLALDSIKR